MRVLDSLVRDTVSGSLNRRSLRGGEGLSLAVRWLAASIELGKL